MIRVSVKVCDSNRDERTEWAYYDSNINSDGGSYALIEKNLVIRIDLTICLPHEHKSQHSGAMRE